MKRIVFIVSLMVALCLGCSQKIYTLSGRTMGTTYHITVFSDINPESRDMTEKINQRLAAINRSMSLFDDSSELSRFNALKPGETFCVSEDFIRVFETGKTLYRLTGGAWDGSIGPLVNLWGFGKHPDERSIPTKKEIENALKQTGYDNVDVGAKGNCLIKKKQGLILDFGSIAKGYAVDVITELLKKNGFDHALVEIGGEVKASGIKGVKPWMVGINTPSPEAPVNQVITAIELHDKAIATSGDYRNFRKNGGKSYTHVIDPATGRPVDNHVASVSVLSQSTTFADGLATALMVMGPEKGIPLVNSLDGVECLFILRSDDGIFTSEPSTGWPGKKAGTP